MTSITRNGGADAPLPIFKAIQSLPPQSLLPIIRSFGRAPRPNLRRVAPAQLAPTANPDSRGSFAHRHSLFSPGRYRPHAITFARPGSGTGSLIG
jgi:hypothetical protein